MSSIESIVKYGLGSYWSRTSAADIVEKHPWAPAFRTNADKLKAVEFVRQHRANPTEAEAIAMRDAAHAEYDAMFARFARGLRA